MTRKKEEGEGKIRGVLRGVGPTSSSFRSSRTFRFTVNTKHSTSSFSLQLSHAGTHTRPNMLPPVDPTTLQRSPNFETLYKDLCTRKLNPDGSTRDTKKQRMHDEIRRVRSPRIRPIPSKLCSNAVCSVLLSRPNSILPHTSTRSYHLLSTIAEPREHTANKFTESDNCPLNPPQHTDTHQHIDEPALPCTNSAR
jgi:hypothetical protein